MPGRLNAALLVCAALLALGAPLRVVAEDAVVPLAPSPSPEQLSPSDSDERIWIAQGTSVQGLHETLSVKYTPEHAVGETVRFDCDVHCDDAIESGTIRLKIVDKAGKALFSAHVPTSLAAGPNLARFEWPTKDLADGEYSANFTLIHNPGEVAATSSLSVRKISRGELARESEHAEDRVRAIRDHLTQLAGHNDKPSSPLVRLALAEDALVQGKAAAASSRWTQALDLVRYSAFTADSVAAQLALLDSSNESVQTVTEPDLGALSRENGRFISQGKPVFLIGVSGTAGRTDALERVGRYGLNLYSFALNPADTLADEKRDADLSATLDGFFSDAKRRNISLACALTQNVIPDWANQKWPEARTDSAGGTPIANLTNAHTQALIERHIRNGVKYLSGQPMVNSVALTQKPEFQWGGEQVRAGFTAYVTDIYKDRDALNAAWRKRLRDLEDVDIWWDYARSSYQYDWQTYHAQLGTEYLGNLNATAKSVAPGMPFRIDVEDTILQNGKRDELLKRENVRRVQTTEDPRDRGVGRGESVLGVDRESIAKVFDVNGCVSSDSMTDPVYALDYPGDNLLYTLLRSFAPDKPVLNSELRFETSAGLDARHTSRYIYSTLWDSAISGLNAAAVNVDMDATGEWGGIFALPENREALATACLDLNRLAPIVSALQSAPADVAILWSMPSKIYEKGYPYLPSVRRAYEGCSFAGRRVRFITETQCSQQGFEGVSFLVLPQLLAVSEATFHAIQDYVKNDGVIVRSGSPIPYNERGSSRHEVIPGTFHTVLVRGVDSPSQYLNALDAAYALGTVKDIPRLVNDEGYPLEGVKTSYVEFEGEQYLYVLNLRTTQARCVLLGRTKSGRDLIQGRDITFPRLVPSLEPMLIRLTHTAAKPAPALAAASDEPKTAVVKPVAGAPAAKSGGAKVEEKK